MYSCYVIVSSSSKDVYTGVTNNFVKRLRQHNGEISGGAKSTRGKNKNWKPLLLISGFQTYGLALQFERLMKGKKIYLTKNTHTIVRLTSGSKGISGRIKQLEKCLPIFSSSKLHVTCFLSKTEYLKHAKLTENEFETGHTNNIFTFTK